MQRTFRLQGGIELKAQRDVPGSMHYDVQTRALMPVRYAVVMMFPPDPDDPTTIAAGYGVGGKSWKEAFGRLRVQLARYGPARARFVDD